MTTQEQIIQLTIEWYNLVNQDHHKDRDCHWCIQTVYSYGEPPTHTIQHSGYVYERILKYFNTYEEAEEGLIKELQIAISKYNQQEHD